MIRSTEMKRGFCNPKLSREIKGSPKEKHKRNGHTKTKTRSRPQGIMWGKWHHPSSTVGIGGQHSSNSTRGNRVGTFLHETNHYNTIVGRSHQNSYSQSFEVHHWHPFINDILDTSIPLGWKPLNIDRMMELQTPTSTSKHTWCRRTYSPMTISSYVEYFRAHQKDLPWHGGINYPPDYWYIRHTCRAFRWTIPHMSTTSELLEFNDFMSNLTSIDLRTPESAYAYMQSMPIPLVASYARRGHQAWTN